MPAVPGDPTTNPLEPPPRVPASRSRWFLAGVLFVVLAAFALRLVYLQQVSTIPFFSRLVGDAQAYDEWAGTLAAGNWWGDDAFYQAPLYPYFLAVLKTAFGQGPFAARLVQAALGAGACGLLALAGAAFFSRRAGLWAGAILAVYPPALFFDGLIQKTSLGQFLGAALLALVAWTQTRPRLAGIVGVGLVAGLFALTRENALALVPILVVWAVWVAGCDIAGPRGRSSGAEPALSGLGRRLWLRRAGWTLAFLAGLAVVLVPVGLRNWRLGGGFALTTVQMGPNFFIGNNPDATGRYRPLVEGHETPEFERADATRLAEEAAGRTLSPQEVSDFWMRRAWQYIRSEPLDWLKLLATKTLLVLNAYEIADAESFYIYGQWSWLLGVLSGFVHFGVLLPLAAAGVVFTLADRRGLWVLYAVALVTIVSVAAFYVFARYRYPLVPVAVLFAGAGVACVIERLRAQRWRAVAGPVAVGAAVALMANVRMNPEAELNAAAWGNLGTALAMEGRLDPAVACFERAVRGSPRKAEMRYNLGLAYAQQGRLQEAVEQFGAALSLAPDLVEVDYQLAVALERLGRREEALNHYRRALHHNPADQEARRAIERLSMD